MSQDAGFHAEVPLEGCGRRERAPPPTRQGPAAPRPTQRPAQLRGRVFRGTTAVRRGLLTPNDLRSRAWRRLIPDVYAGADHQNTHSLRARAAGRLLLPHGVLTGASAAGLWGVELAGPDDEVEVTVAPGAARSRAPGVTVRRRALAPACIRPVDGVRATAPETTALE